VQASPSALETPKSISRSPPTRRELEIVERLCTHQDVLVQGPPGTGKSHTIANLICHLLATGPRILVTGHTPRALMVLKDKIPEQVADLCVSFSENRWMPECLRPLCTCDSLLGPRGGSTMKHPVNADVLVDVGPMHS
jgi:AAA domain